MITSHPQAARVQFPASATFRVQAAGADLRYQWQKNRADIPGANAPTYTTPPTSLWDIGSAYRCIVSNPAGTARSVPGILNPDHGAPD